MFVGTAIEGKHGFQLTVYSTIAGHCRTISICFLGGVDESPEASIYIVSSEHIRLFLLATAGECSQGK